MTGEPLEPRELLGRIVRQVWVQWAREQPDPKPSWLLGWDDLDDAQREVDMRIGLELFDRGKCVGIEIGKAMKAPGDDVRAKPG